MGFGFGFLWFGFIGGSGLEIPSTEATLLQYSSVRISRDPRRTISESTGAVALSDKARVLVHEEWNKTYLPHPRDSCCCATG